MSDTSEEPAGDGRGQLDREAARWCARMHSEDAEVWRDQFERWLRRGALHRRAYNRIEEVYLLAGKLRPQTLAPPPEAPPWHRVRHLRPALLALGGATLAVIGLFAWQNNGARDVHTGAGLALPSQAPLVVTSNAPTQLALADGSGLVLAARSRVRVAFGARERRIMLDTGAARFSVAHEMRPFIVWAGGGSVTARGTLFEVSAVTAGRVDVHLIQGKVDVTFPFPAAGRDDAGVRTAHLRAGERISYPIAPSPRATDPEAQWSATQPRTLGELVDLANAMPDSRDQLVVEDASLRTMWLSGAFRVHGSAVVADRLATMLGLTIDRSRAGFLILRRRSTP